MRMGKPITLMEEAHEQARMGMFSINKRLRPTMVGQCALIGGFIR